MRHTIAYSLFHPLLQYIPDDRRDRGDLSRIRLRHFCGLLLLLKHLLILGALLRVLDGTRTRDCGAAPLDDLGWWGGG
jgi:hypothetical protein